MKSINSICDSYFIPYMCLCHPIILYAEMFIYLLSCARAFDLCPHVVCVCALHWARTLWNTECTKCAFTRYAHANNNWSRQTTRSDNKTSLSIWSLLFVLLHNEKKNIRESKWRTNESVHLNYYYVCGNVAFVHMLLKYRFDCVAAKGTAIACMAAIAEPQQITYYGITKWAVPNKEEETIEK